MGTWRDKAGNLVEASPDADGNERGYMCLPLAKGEVGDEIFLFRRAEGDEKDVSLTKQILNRNSQIGRG